MNAPNAVIKTKVARVTDAPRIVYNTGRLRKPSPLPIRPLVPDRFRPPKGQKEVYLPNFTIAFLRTPLQPAHFASFLTPLWLNKLDLKDYLYNLYSVQALRVRSFIIQGKVTRDQRSGRLRRTPPKKKMTIEMAQDNGGGNVPRGQGAFVWPDEPSPAKEEWRRDSLRTEERMLKAAREQSVREERDERVKEDAGRLREKAKALVKGTAQWRPSWVEYGGAMAVAMGRGDGKGDGREERRREREREREKKGGGEEE